MIKDKNFSNVPVGDIPVDLEYVDCNFTRSTPIDIGGGVMRSHRLFPGDDTPRTFTHCNLTNCEPPPGSTLINCNTNVFNGRLVVDVELVLVDSVEVGRNDVSDRVLYGRLNPTTLVYEDLPTPEVHRNKV